MNLKFTQYLRPNGRKIKVETQCPVEVQDQAWDLIDANVAFEIEQLQTGHVSMTVKDPVEDQQIAIQICDNTPDGIKSGLIKLVENAHQRLSSK